ncbi:hypothetical protein ACKFKF_07480 [Phormidesmis sp. 146-12]
MSPGPTATRFVEAVCTQNTQSTMLDGVAKSQDALPPNAEEGQTVQSLPVCGIEEARGWATSSSLQPATPALLSRNSRCMKERFGAGRSQILIFTK